MKPNCYYLFNTILSTYTKHRRRNLKQKYIEFLHEVYRRNVIHVMTFYVVIVFHDVSHKDIKFRYIVKITLHLLITTFSRLVMTTIFFTF